MPGAAFRSPEDRANATWAPAVFPANWRTRPAGAAHRKVTVCYALALLASSIDVAARSAAERSGSLMAPPIFLYQPFSAHVLQTQSERVNDLPVPVRLALFDDEMFKLAAILAVQIVLMSEAVARDDVLRDQGAGVVLIDIGARLAVYEEFDGNSARRIRRR
jgi:hypothetical protein